MSQGVGVGVDNCSRDRVGVGAGVGRRTPSRVKMTSVTSPKMPRGPMSMSLKKTWRAAALPVTPPPPPPPPYGRLVPGMTRPSKTTTPSGVTFR
jgi:hypothetical protein